MDLLCTQQLPHDFDESFVSDEEEKKQVGTLVIEKNEKLNLLLSEHPIFEGENIVGRHEDCDICIPNGIALSKKHACIEAKGNSSYLFDCGSSNKTKLGSLRLKPEVRYCLQNGDNIVFANIKCVFQKFDSPISVNSSVDNISNETDDVLTPKQAHRSQLLAVDTPEAMQERKPAQHLNISLHANVVPDSQPTNESTVELNGTSLSAWPLTASVVDASDCDQTYEEDGSLSNNGEKMEGSAVDTDLEDAFPDKERISSDNKVDDVTEKKSPFEKIPKKETSLFSFQQGSENVEDTTPAMKTQSYSNSQNVSKKPGNNVAQSDSDTDVEDEYSMLADAETQAFFSSGLRMGVQMPKNPVLNHSLEKVNRVSSPKKSNNFNQVDQLPSESALDTSPGRAKVEESKCNILENESKQVSRGLSKTVPPMVTDIAGEKSQGCAETIYEDTLSMLETQYCQGDYNSAGISSEQKTEECAANDSDSDTDIDEQYSMLTTATTCAFPVENGNIKKTGDSNCEGNETVMIAEKLENLKNANKSPLSKALNEAKSIQEDKIRNTIVSENTCQFKNVAETGESSGSRPVMRVTPERKNDQASSNNAAEDTLSMLETQSFPERDLVCGMTPGKDAEVQSDSDEEDEFFKLASLETQTLPVECSRMVEEPPCSMNRGLNEKSVENKSKIPDAWNEEIKSAMLEKLPSPNIDKTAEIEQKNAIIRNETKNVNEMRDDMVGISLPATACGAQTQDRTANDVKLPVDDDNLQIQLSTSKKNTDVSYSTAAGSDKCKISDTTRLPLLASDKATEAISNLTQADEYETCSSDFMATQVYAVGEVTVQSSNLTTSHEVADTKIQGLIETDHMLANSEHHAPCDKFIKRRGGTQAEEVIKVPVKRQTPTFAVAEPHDDFDPRDLIPTQMYSAPNDADHMLANSEEHAPCKKFIKRRGGTQAEEVIKVPVRRQTPTFAVAEPHDDFDPRDLMPTQMYSAPNETTENDTTSAPTYLTATDCMSSSKRSLNLSESEILDDDVISDDDIFSTGIQNSQSFSGEYTSQATQPFGENEPQSSPSVAVVPGSAHGECISASSQTSRCEEANNAKEKCVSSVVRSLRKRRVANRNLNTDDYDFNKLKKQKLVTSESSSQAVNVPKKRKLKRSPKVKKVQSNLTDNSSGTGSSQLNSTFKEEKTDVEFISSPQSHEANSNPTNKHPKTKVARSKAKTLRKDNTSVVPPATALTCVPSINSASTRKSEFKKSSAARKCEVNNASTFLELTNNNATTKDDQPALVSLRPRKLKPKVMFTGVVDKIGEKTVKNLGGHMTDDVFECTHLVTDKIRRTVKFLCAVARGIHIVNQEWLRESQLDKRFISEENFELTNASLSQASSSSLNETNLEDVFDFNLTTSLSVARSRASPLMENIRIHVTKSVLPPPEQMYQIISCAGGECVRKLPRGEKLKAVVVVSVDEDRRSCSSAIKANVPIVSKEYILTGVLRQKLEVENFQLFNTAPPDENCSTRKCKIKSENKSSVASKSNVKVAEQSVCDSSPANRRSLRKRKAC